MKKRIMIAIICLGVFLLAGCASTPELVDTFNGAELDRRIATELAGAFATSGPTENYVGGVNVPYEQALQYFLHYGFYGGKDKVRPELEGYEKAGAYVIPAEVVDTYITAHFPTVVSYTNLDCYDAESHTYTLKPVPADGSKFRMVSKTWIRDDVYAVIIRDTDPAVPKIGVKVNTFSLWIEFNEEGYKFLAYEYNSANYIRNDQSVPDSDGIHWYVPALAANQSVEVVNDGFKETKKGCQVTEDGGKTFSDVVTRKEALALALEEAEKDRYNFDDVNRNYVATKDGAEDVELIRIESTYDPYWKTDWEKQAYDHQKDPLLWMVRLVDKNDSAISLYIYLDVKTGTVMGAGTLSD